MDRIIAEAANGEVDYTTNSKKKRPMPDPHERAMGSLLRVYWRRMTSVMTKPYTAFE